MAFLKEQKEKKERTIDMYMQRMFRIIVFVCPLFTITAAIVFSIFVAVGFYSNISQAGLIVFDASCVLYVAIGVILTMRCRDETGNVKKSYFNVGKWFLLISLLIQFNFIAYLFPVCEIWAYAPFFLLATVVFLDLKLVLVDAIALLISVIISWIIRPDVLMPLNTEHFYADMILRAICLVFSMGALFVITFIVRKICITDLPDQLVVNAEKKAKIDDLTGLGNRRAYVEFYESINNPAKTGVVFADVNSLKYTNDNFGHEEGDRLINQFAGIFSDCFRKEDLFRISGDEFVALCPEIEKEVFEQRVAKLVRALSSLPSSIASVGSIYGGENLKEMIAEAERRMYLSKDEYYRRFPERKR